MKEKSEEINYRPLCVKSILIDFSRFLVITEDVLISSQINFNVCSFTLTSIAVMRCIQIN